MGRLGVRDKKYSIVELLDCSIYYHKSQSKKITEAVNGLVVLSKLMGFYVHSYYYRKGPGICFVNNEQEYMLNFRRNDEGVLCKIELFSISNDGVWEKMSSCDHHFASYIKEVIKYFK